MRRFFYNTCQGTPLKKNNIGDNILLTEDIHHHWCRVLKAKIGNQAYLFDGFGGAYKVELTDITKKDSTVQLIEFNNTDNTPDILTEIGLVMSRGDRLDYAIQKATEMGVTIIQLLTSQHCEVRLKPNQIEKKLNHWQQIALSACEQCGLNRPPIIIAPLTIAEWLKQTPIDFLQKTNNISDSVKPFVSDDFYRLSLNADSISLVLSVPKNKKNQTPNQLLEFIKKHNGKEQLLTVSNPNQVNIKTPSTIIKTLDEQKPLFRVLVGPEGGLTSEEISLVETVKYYPWQIGNRVLRTETSPVVALAALQTMYTAI